MVAWDNMLEEGLQVHHQLERMSGKSHIGDSGLWLPNTTWAALPAGWAQLQNLSNTSTWNFTSALHASILVVSSSISEGPNEKEGASPPSFY